MEDRQKTNYHGEFHNWFGVLSVFDISKSEYFEEPEYVWAEYDMNGYGGEAFVLYRNDSGRWWLVGGTHCSCHGLEDQWEPKEIDPSIHLNALQNGKRYLATSDRLQKYFDEWLIKVVIEEWDRKIQLTETTIYSNNLINF